MVPIDVPNNPTEDIMNCFDFSVLEVDIPHKSEVLQQLKCRWRCLASLETLAILVMIKLVRVRDLTHVYWHCVNQPHSLLLAMFHLQCTLLRSSNQCFEQQRLLWWEQINGYIQATYSKRCWVIQLTFCRCGSWPTHQVGCDIHIANGAVFKGLKKK